MVYLSNDGCEGCGYYYCGINTCFCEKYVNDLHVPRIIRNAPKRPLWCPKEKKEDNDEK